MWNLYVFWEETCSMFHTYILECHSQTIKKDIYIYETFDSWWKMLSTRSNGCTERDKEGVRERERQQKYWRHFCFIQFLNSRSSVVFKKNLLVTFSVKFTRQYLNLPHTNTIFNSYACFRWYFLWWFFNENVNAIMTEMLNTVEIN